MKHERLKTEIVVTQEKHQYEIAIMAIKSGEPYAFLHLYLYLYVYLYVYWYWSLLICVYFLTLLGEERRRRRRTSWASRCFQPEREESEGKSVGRGGGAMRSRPSWSRNWP